MRIGGWLLAALCATGLSGPGFGVVSVAAAEENWPEFRGPHGDGTTTAVGLPLKWSETENIAWKVPIHGRGWSSPVIWGNQVWLTTATEDGKKLYGVCLDKESGKVIHDLLLFEVAEPRFCHPTNSYASCSPAIEEGKVYLHFGSYGTACVDTKTGEKLWERRDFVSDDFRGPGSSPVLDDERVYINFDGVDFQFVVALDKKTGQTVWLRKREIDYQTDNGDNKKAYGTPQLIEVNGKKQLVSPAAMATIAYEPATGSPLWTVRHGGMNAAARPLYGNGLVYISAGDGSKALVAIKPDGTGDVTSSHLAWASGLAVPKRSSQILVGEHLYMVGDDGIASCRSALTGTPVWKERLPGKYWSSPILAEGRIYFNNQEGETTVIAAKPEYELLASNKLDDGGNASIAASGKALFLRTGKHLYRIQNP